MIAGFYDVITLPVKLVFCNRRLRVGTNFNTGLDSLARVLTRRDWLRE